VTTRDEPLSPPPDEVYRTRLAQFQAVATSEDERSRWYSRARLLAAGASLAALLAVIQSPSPWSAAALGLGVVLFLRLVLRHDRVEQRREAALALVRLNREALARRARAWQELPAPWHPNLPDNHPFAADLDVFGHASLVQVIGPVRTPTGRRTLTQWLLHGATSTPGEMRARQDAVRELIPALDFRQYLAALARLLPEGTGDGDAHALTPAVRWAEGPRGIEAQPWVPLVAMALTIITLAGLVGTIAGVVTGAWWLLTGILGWVLRWWVHEPLEASIHGASGEHGLRPWAAAIDHVHATRFGAGLLAAARNDLEGAPGALRALEQLVALSDIRHSAWVFVPLHTLTQWDLHVWWAIERWRRLHGQQVRVWLDAVGCVDAASGLASLAYDQPTWIFPAIDESLARVNGTAVGHPLLADSVRVANDVQLGPPGRFLLITGSNMSGKSTLLRAIGLNVVLAQAGGPVCAGALALPPLALHTSMRVSDSLELGLSLFMASLLRLQQIVTAARTATAGRRVCFLLDEVLQGTNSAERQIAVRTVVDHLLHCEAIGAVTTHDLELARDPGFTAHADSFHLQETLSGSGADIAMTFDYRLRTGPAQAGNALQLLRMLGLAPESGA
jgi:hypothetical protein